MRMPSFPDLAVAACLALTACDHEPTFDASSPAAYLKSLGEITAKLSPEDQRKLDIALLTLALGNTVQTNALQLANSDSLDDLVTLKRVANPLYYLDRVRPGISEARPQSYATLPPISITRFRGARARRPPRTSS